MPWIGKTSEELTNSKRFSLNNPNSICICGSNQMYKNCCLKKHFEFETKRKFTPADLDFLQKNLTNTLLLNKISKRILKIFNTYLLFLINIFQLKNST